jgi:phosphohistidine phosphatase SixA
MCVCVLIPCVQTNVAIEQLQHFVEHDLDDIKLVSHEPFVRTLFEMYEMDNIRSQVRAVCVLVKRSCWRLKPKSGKSDLMGHLFRFRYPFLGCVLGCVNVYCMNPCVRVCVC